MQIQDYLESLKGTNLLLTILGSSIAVVIGLMIGGQWFGHKNVNAATMLTLPNQPAISSPQPVQPAPAAIPQQNAAVPATGFETQVNAWSLMINTCNGQAANANLRQFASINAPVVTVLPNGSTVNLTGMTANGDGGVWYEAISPIGQRGWISACFIGG
jgi:hypothetical protein